MSASCRESLCIDAAHPALPGHFPGNPVVPGVVLLERVLEFAQRRFGLHADALRMPQVKFLQPLLPEQVAEMVLERVATGPATVDSNRACDTRVRFRIERDGTLLASGELIAPAPAAPMGAA
jgi:3-hydroxymyristoyl/3-hydroxydecanoyl-(acyl carrier protein) dehydratase